LDTQKRYSKLLYNLWEPHQWCNC